MKKGIKTLITASPLIKKPGNKHSASISCQYTKVQKNSSIKAIFVIKSKQFLNHQRRNSITERIVIHIKKFQIVKNFVTEQNFLYPQNFKKFQGQNRLFSLKIFCFSHSIQCKKNGTSLPGQPTNLLRPFLVPSCSTYLPT